MAINARRAVPLSALCLLMLALAACGPTYNSDIVPYPCGVDLPTTSRALDEFRATGGGETLTPVGIRSGGEFIIIDVLITRRVYSKDLPAGPLAFYLDVNRLVRDFTSKGRGILLRDGDGREIPLVPFDISQPQPDGVARLLHLGFYSVSQLHDAPMPGDIRVDAAVIPIMARCSAPITPGSTLFVRFEPRVQPAWGDCSLAERRCTVTRVD